MGCFVIILIGLAMYGWSSSSPQTYIPAVIIAVAITIVMRKTNKDFKEKAIKEKEEEENYLANLIKKYNVPSNSKKIYYKSGHPSIQKTFFNMFIWCDEEKLYFVDEEASDNIGKIEICLRDIEYYKTRGEIHKETKISGGGTNGGGSSIGGAIIGGLIAGQTGAIIGSRKKIESQPITTKTVMNDERETYLQFLKNNRKHSMFFSYEGCNLLSDIIPDKLYTNTSNKYVLNQINRNHDSKDKILEQIRELGELQNDGILTKEEFQEKKKELLSRI